MATDRAGAVDGDFGGSWISVNEAGLTLALLKCVEIIGEAAARVGEETRGRHSSLPWADMIGMRNRLVHGYFDIDLSLLWATITEDLPELIRELDLVVGEDEEDA